MSPREENLPGLGRHDMTAGSHPRQNLDGNQKQREIDREGGEMEGLSEEERKALRGSKFAPLPPPPTSRFQQPRLAHPGGPLKTNKAAALAKFLERKLQDPHGLASIDPDILELAVKNAKDTVLTSGTSKSGTIIHHVTDLGDFEEPFEEKQVENSLPKKQNRKKKKKEKKNKKPKIVEDSERADLKKRKKKLKF